MFKRIVCTLLTVILVLTSAAAAFAESDITFPLVDEPLTLKFMAPRPSNFANGYADMKLFKEYEEKTGIHIEWEEVPESGWAEKIQLVLNSFDLPDVVYGGDLSVSDAARYGKEGVLIPLNDLIEEHTVNLKHWLEERPEDRKSVV